MSRNRRHQTAAVRFGPVLKALILCALLGGSGIGFVWQKDQINTLGDRIQQCEKQLEQICRNNDQLQKILDSMQTPSEIEARLRESNLGMVAPGPHEIVRLADPVETISGTADETLYADQRFRWWAHR